jgi:hypothetical protein
MIYEPGNKACIPAVKIIRTLGFGIFIIVASKYDRGL